MEQNMRVSTKKIQLKVVGDDKEKKRVYKYLRDGMEVQSIIMNEYMSFLYTAKKNDMPADEMKEKKAAYGRVAGSAKGSPYDYKPEMYPTGLPLVSSAQREVNAKFGDFCKKGLMYGVMSLPTYRKTNPLLVHNNYVNIRGMVRVAQNQKTGETYEKSYNTGLYYEYESPADFLDALYHERTPELYLAFANNITFRLVLGDIRESYELRKTIERCFNEEYKICDSKIKIDDGKIILLLAVKMPVEKKAVLDEDTTGGVDIGLAKPAVCALNNAPYKRCNIGSYDEFTYKRETMQRMRRSLQTNLKDTKGGHGRKKKLQKLEIYKKYERNFARTYNHMVSKRVVDFALQNKAKYINIEDLSGYSKEDRSNFVLRNWSYYELQQMIIEKAAAHGIIVRKVAPAYTSQICPVCGHKGIGVKQPNFTCTNPACRCYDEVQNIDFIAAKNIAASVDYTKEGLKILPKEYAEKIEEMALKGECNIVISQKNIEAVKDLEKAGVLLLKKDTKYFQNLIYQNGVVKILCEDGYYHEFDSYLDLKDYIKESDFKAIKAKFEKKKKDDEDDIQTDED